LQSKCFKPFRLALIFPAGVFNANGSKKCKPVRLGLLSTATGTVALRRALTF
jgi:hypothetical protein